MLGLGANRQFPAVMLIDDDEVSREVLATLLTMEGYTIYTAKDGAAAVELLANGKCVPEVILVDAQMPGLSGARLIGELRARTRATVIAISGSQPPKEIAACADGFLLKPFGVTELGKLLEHENLTRETQPAPVPVTNPDESVVSAETLERLRAIMPETAVRRIYEAVVTDLGQRLQALEAAIARSDLPEVRRIGHAIKGGCGMAGAVEAARLGARIEALGSNDLDNGNRLLADLRTATRNLESILEAEIPG
jgi:CheY-like chemotaxis protein